MNNKKEENKIDNSYIKFLAEAVVGPSISALLERFVIQNPSELLVGFIYFLGFSLSAFKLWLSIKHRKIDFLEKMVYRKQKKNGEELEGGIIDSNSVGMTEWVSKI